MQPPWKTPQQVLKTWNTQLRWDPAIPLLRVCPRERTAYVHMDLQADSPRCALWGCSNRLFLRTAGKP